MLSMQSKAIICDTSVLLYLGRINHLPILDQLYDDVYVTTAVCDELSVGRILKPNTVNPHHINWLTIVDVPQSLLDQLPSNRLGKGERSMLAYAQHHQIDVVGLDDRQARALAKRMGLTVIGVLGLFVQAKTAGLIPQVAPLIEQVQNEGLYLSSKLVDRVLVSMSETPKSL